MKSLRKTFEPINIANIPGTRSALVGLLALAWLLGSSPTTLAASLVVTNLADAGPGTLRDAIATANTNGEADVITFDATLDGQSISLSGGELMLSNTVTIDASALFDGIAITVDTSAISAAVPSQRIFEVVSNAVVELDHLTIRGGGATDPTKGSPESANTSDYHPTQGGGILVDGGTGTLVLNHCTLSGNYAQWNGGAISLVTSGFTLTLNHCTISRNIAAFGGGIFCRSGNTVIVNNSTLSGNAAYIRGGGTHGSITINNSTLYDNYAIIAGGGSDSANPVAVNNSTFCGNSASHGGGIFNSMGLLTVNNSTLSENVAYTKGGGIGTSGFFLVEGHLTNSIVTGNSAPTNSNLGSTLGSNNLTNGNALLAPLGSYGGPTLTMPPLAGSPAIDAGEDSVTNFLTTDQRGYPRLSGAHVDIGAVELQAVDAANAPVLTNPTKQANGAFGFGFASSPDADFTVLASTNVALPSSQWTILGWPTQNSPGQYVFTDPFASDFRHRFYQVVSP